MEKGKRKQTAVRTAEKQIKVWERKRKLAETKLKIWRRKLAARERAWEKWRADTEPGG